MMGADEGRPPTADRAHFVHRIASEFGVEFREEELRGYDDGERSIGD